MEAVMQMQLAEISQNMLNTLNKAQEQANNNLRRELEQIRTQIDEDKLQMLTKINKQDSVLYDFKVNFSAKLDALQLTSTQQHEETRATATANMSLIMNAIQGQKVQTQETQASYVRSFECATVSLGDPPTQTSDAVDSVMNEPASSVKRPFFSSVDSADQPSKQKGGRGPVKSTSVSQGGNLPS